MPNDIVNAQDLDLLLSQPQRYPQGPVVARDVFVTEDFRDEPLARMPHENGTTQILKPGGVVHELDVVLMCLAKPNPGIKADTLGIDSMIEEKRISLS